MPNKCMCFCNRGLTIQTQAVFNQNTTNQIQCTSIPSRGTDALSLLPHPFPYNPNTQSNSDVPNIYNSFSINTSSLSNQKDQQKDKVTKIDWGAGLVQWLKRWTGDPKVEPHQEHKENFEFFWVKKVVLTRLSMCPTPVCIRTHTKNHVRMLKIL